MPTAVVKPFYEKSSGTCCYIVSCPDTKKAVIIDSVLDYNANSASTSTEFADSLLEHVKTAGLDVEWSLETHAHADHITAAQYLKQQLGGKVKTAIGKLITGVQATFKGVYRNDMDTTGKEFDHLFDAGETFNLGNLRFEVMHAPGHTPDHLAYLLRGDAVFTGDSMFMPDSGTARCDFPKGSAQDLWNTNQNLLALDPNTRVFVGHDYGKDGREPAWETTVKEQREKNIHVKEGTEMSEFVEWRANRDGTLGHPRLIIPAIQVNVQAGKFPVDEEGGVYIKTPINTLKEGKGVVKI